MRGIQQNVIIVTSKVYNSSAINQIVLPYREPSFAMTAWHKIKFNGNTHFKKTVAYHQVSTIQFVHRCKHWLKK